MFELSGGVLGSASAGVYGGGGSTVGRIGGINMNRILNSMEAYQVEQGAEQPGLSSLRHKNRGTFFPLPLRTTQGCDDLKIVFVSTDYSGMGSPISNRKFTRWGGGN